MLGMAILLGFNLLGAGIKMLLHLPLPANVIGLILFTVSLYTGLIKLEWVKATALFLTKHMMLFFIPFLVGTMAFLPFIGANLFSMVFTLFGSTFIVLAVTGWMTERLSREAAEGDGKYDQ